MTHPSISRVTTIILRMVFILALVAGLMIGSLKLLERSGEPLRQGVERFIAESTQSHAYLKEMKDPKFFPDIDMTLKGIVLSARGDATKKTASIESVELASPFIGTIIGRPMFEKLSVENAVIEKETVFPRALHIKQGRIIDEGNKPLLSFSGTLGKTPVSLQIDMQREGNNPPRYTLLPGAPTVYIQGDIKVEGALTARREGTMLENAVMSDKSGGKWGPENFILLKNQGFVKDNPISCLMGLETDSRLTQAHPCATLFDQSDTEEKKQ